MDAKPKLKIGQRVFFLIPKRSNAGRGLKANRKYIVQSGTIQEICDVCAIIKTKNQSVHDRAFANIFLSQTSAKKLI